MGCLQKAESSSDISTIPHRFPSRALGEKADDGDLSILTHLQWQVPCNVYMGLVVVHPHLSHPQCIPLGVKANVIVVRLFLALNVGHSRARENLHAATTQPYLERLRQGRKDNNRKSVTWKHPLFTHMLTTITILQDGIFQIHFISLEYLEDLHYSM